MIKIHEIYKYSLDQIYLPVLSKSKKGVSLLYFIGKDIILFVKF